MTYGEQAVGLSFNPSGSSDVERVKRLYAEIIDLCAKERDSLDKNARGERARLFSIAITEAQTAQMWAVKALTWQENL